jgi:hypothetical protein
MRAVKAEAILKAKGVKEGISGACKECAQGAQPLSQNDYKIDAAKMADLIRSRRPDLVVFGKSMFISREPVAEACAAAADLSPRPVIMPDMAHVLGLIGPHFQEPFKEGEDLVTGSTHKTFFGCHRRVIASNMVKTLGAFFVRGDPRWHYNLPGKPIFDPILAAFFGLGIFVALRRGQLDHLAVGGKAFTEIAYQVRQTSGGGSDLANGVLQVGVSRADKRRAGLGGDQPFRRVRGVRQLQSGIGGNRGRA